MNSYLTVCSQTLWSSMMKQYLPSRIICVQVMLSLPYAFDVVSGILRLSASSQSHYCPSFAVISVLVFVVYILVYSTQCHFLERFCLELGSLTWYSSLFSGCPLQFVLSTRLIPSSADSVSSGDIVSIQMSLRLSIYVPAEILLQFIGVWKQQNESLP